jgi:hypothetical protein
MLSIYQIRGTVKAAHQRGLSPEDMSGLWKSGIFPFDRYLFTDEDFLGSYNTDQP